MTYSVLVRAGAERDIEEALDWYSANAPEQAGRFIDELVAAIERVRKHPYAFRLLRGDARRVALSRLSLSDLVSNPR